MMTTPFIRTVFKGFFSISGVLLLLALTVSISQAALTPSILNQSTMGGDFVASRPIEKSKFFELGAQVISPQADDTNVTNTVKSFSSLIGESPLVIEGGNKANKASYAVSMTISYSSGETASNKLTDQNHKEVIIGTLSKPKNSNDFVFNYANPNDIPSFLGTYTSSYLDSKNTNLWSYVRITSLKMDYYTEDGSIIPVANENYSAIDPSMENMTNGIFGGTFCPADSSGGYTMKSKIPSRIAFGIFYPKTLNFRGLNSNWLWGIEVFGFTCPKTITVQTYRSNATNNTPIADKIIYERAEKPFLFIIYSYKISQSTDDIVTDVTPSLDSAGNYKYQLKFDYQTASDPFRFSAVKDIQNNTQDNRFFIFFSKNQFKEEEITHI